MRTLNPFAVGYFFSSEPMPHHSPAYFPDCMFLQRLVSTPDLSGLLEKWLLVLIPFPSDFSSETSGSARARARACGKSRFRRYPYSAARAGAIRTSGGKAMKLALASTLQSITARFSALTRFRGQRAQVERLRTACDAHTGFVRGLSVDRQGMGHKRGLCWRATRDGLRHMPACPPKSTQCGKPISARL